MKIIELKLRNDRTRVTAYFLWKRIGGRKPSMDDDRKVERYLARAIDLVVAQVVHEEAEKELAKARTKEHQP